MNYDIDEMSVELSKEMQMDPLEKTLPPKIRYRYYKWLKRFSGNNPHISQSSIQAAVHKAMQDLESIKSLKKHQAAASFFDDGTVRLDFGAKVDEKVKKAALDWARRRGLKTIEESINKSADANSYKVFAKDSVSEDALLVKVVVLNP